MTDADNLIRQLDEKDAEIGRLESLLDRARPLARKNLEQAAEIEELKAEIAALRGACSEARLAMMEPHGEWKDVREAKAIAAVRRALEGK